MSLDIEKELETITKNTLDLEDEIDETIRGWTADVAKALLKRPVQMLKGSKGWWVTTNTGKKAFVSAKKIGKSLGKKVGKGVGKAVAAVGGVAGAYAKDVKKHPVFHGLMAVGAVGMASGKKKKKAAK